MFVGNYWINVFRIDSVCFDQDGDAIVRVGGENICLEGKDAEDLKALLAKIDSNV